MSLIKIEFEAENPKEAVDPMMGILILFGIVMNVIYGQRDNYTGL